MPPSCKQGGNRLKRKWVRPSQHLQQSTEQNTHGHGYRHASPHHKLLPPPPLAPRGQLRKRTYEKIPDFSFFSVNIQTVSAAGGGRGVGGGGNKNPSNHGTQNTNVMTVRAPPTYTGPPAHAAHGLTSQLAKQMQNQGAKGRMYINAGPPQGC